MASTSPARDAAIEPYGSSLEHLRDELARIDLLVRGQVVRARQASGDDPYRGLAISEAEVDALLARAAGAPPGRGSGPLGRWCATASSASAAIRRRRCSRVRSSSTIAWSTGCTAPAS